jgi:uncharacterized protein
MSRHAIIPRLVTPTVLESLSDNPVVLVQGPRQSGKSTLAKEIAHKEEYSYFTFDDESLLSSAKTDPTGFVADLPRFSVIDEVQRAPQIFTAIKSVVDRESHPGRFLLTGSSNVLLIPKLADSLAGRMGLVRLHPLAQCEIEGILPTFIDALFSGSFSIRHTERLGSELTQRVLAGGYPRALARPSEQRRAAWYRDYVDSIIQKDVRDLARISSFEVLPRLLSAAASRTSQLFNLSDLASPFQLSRPTIREYATLLERVYLLELLPPWHVNATSRLIKTPKIHITDTGVASSILGVNAETLQNDRALFGQLLETFVVQELKRQISWRDDSIQCFHFRDRDQYEVDLVLERGRNALVGVEIKASSTVSNSDFAGLRRLKNLAGNRFRSGVVLYDGDVSARFGDSLYAVPIRALWENIF